MGLKLLAIFIIFTSTLTLSKASSFVALDGLGTSVVVAPETMNFLAGLLTDGDILLDIISNPEKAWEKLTKSPNLIDSLLGPELGATIKDVLAFLDDLEPIFNILGGITDFIGR